MSKKHNDTMYFVLFWALRISTAIEPLLQRRIRNNLKSTLKPYQVYSSVVTLTFFFFFKILFLYSWETQRQRQKHRQREKEAPCKEPDVGLNPCQGSCPEPKADTQPLSHSGAPKALILYIVCKSSINLAEAAHTTPKKTRQETLNSKEKDLVRYVELC